jgi:hypothetical protein
VPIIHKGFRVNIRHLMASRNYGQGIDVTHAQEATIKVVELFIRNGQPTDRLYQLTSNDGEWDFLELGLKTRRGKSRIVEVRLTRQITDAPMLAGDVAEVTHNGISFKKPKKGSGRGYHIGTTNRYLEKGESEWTTYTARVDGVTHLLVYATWQGGSGVYCGRLVPKKDAMAHIVEQRTRTKK